MDINDFKTFLEIARTRHFGQAAKNLCITQSAVSARIRQLEEQFGARFFTRERNNIQLTAAGEKMLKYAELILTAWNQARQEISIQKPNQIAVVIGGLPSLWDMTLQDWLQAIYEENTQLVIHAEIHPADVLQQRVLNGALDLAFVFDAANNDNLVIQPLLQIPIILVSSYENQLSQDAVANNYILVDWGMTFMRQHAQFFTDASRPVLYVSHGRIALDLLLRSGGSAYLPEPLVREYIESGRLHVVKDAPVIERTAFVLYNVHSDKEAIIQDLLLYFSK